MWPIIENALEHNGLITAFAVVGAIMWLSVVMSKYLTFGRVHGSAIAIVIGLVLAWVGGTVTGGQKGLADMALFSGIGLMGGAMLRDFAIVATAFEVQATEARKAGMIGLVALLLGTVLPFIVGAAVAYALRLPRCGEHDHHRRGCSDLHRRPCDRGGAGCQLGRDGPVDCHRADQGDPGDGVHPSFCAPAGPGQPALGNGVRRVGRDGVGGDGRAGPRRIGGWCRMGR